MNTKFYIVDDDASIRRVLNNIILRYDLGEVVGEADNGINAFKEIPELQPDIVLIDLLLPGMDGVLIVTKLKEQKVNSAFIMISEVSSKEMVSKAYTNGIEYYINKPINVIEVLYIIKKVCESTNMQAVIQSFENAFQRMNILKNLVGGKEAKLITNSERIKRVLSQLGIIGDSGSNDIVEMIQLLLENDHRKREHLLGQKLSDLYDMLNERYKCEYKVSCNTAAIEQRIRRTIIKALSNIANLGLEDYSNDIFIKYSNTIFDFKEVREQMNYIRGKSNYGGKISVKKFIEGILLEVSSET